MKIKDIPKINSIIQNHKVITGYMKSIGEKDAFRITFTDPSGNYRYVEKALEQCGIVNKVKELEEEFRIKILALIA